MPARLLNDVTIYCANEKNNKLPFFIPAGVERASEFKAASPHFAKRGKPLHAMQPPK